MCAKATTSEEQHFSLPIKKFRLHGLRKLNWIERYPSINYREHLHKTGFDRWIEPGALVIIIGPNAGGKSTIIDLLRSIADSSLWPTLARENYPSEDFSEFSIEGLDFILHVKFSKWVPEDQDFFEEITISAEIGKKGATELLYRVQAPKFPSTDPWGTDLQALLDRRIGIKVYYYPATDDQLASGIEDHTLIELLNELSEYFPSVCVTSYLPSFCAFNGEGSREGRIGVLFKDDPIMHSFVHRKMLPLGWVQLASVLYFLRSCKLSSLILLDEPDRHLHPSLQRALLEIIARERARLNAQIFIATHSSVLINSELCTRVDAKVISVSRGRCEQIADNRQILDDLGVTSSDLLQANGVIWVEGPSDRIYLKRWLELYAASLGQDPPIERIHYMFVTYGGSLLKHVTLSAEPHDDHIALRALNRNFSVVIDRDLCPQDDNKLMGEKKRLLQEAAALNSQNAVWVTKLYTIEAYLPMEWEFRRHIVENSQGRICVTGIGKVELARKFAKANMEWKTSHLAETDMPIRIADLFKRIRDWQSAQEIIISEDVPFCLKNMSEKECS